MKKLLSVALALLLALNPSLGLAVELSGGLVLPPAGEMIRLSAPLQPVLVRGLTIDPLNPMKFDFIVDPGGSAVTDQQIKEESQRMVNYFLATLAVPQKDLWVNLSPVEKDRIIPDALIKTELGRDLLAQDYVLKQLTASLIYPEADLGKGFWQKIYDEAFQKFGVTEVPVDVFNKVWIVPETASVFEKGNTVYIAKTHMKVMLESDYQAKVLSAGVTGTPVEELSKRLLREVVVPVIEKEVNEGANFSRLRQAVYAMVLAQWYQDVLKDSVINKVYAGRSKVAGIDLSNPANKELIYQQYMDAYKKGVYNYIKEETDRLSNEPMPRKYFSGGMAEVRVQRQNADPRDAAQVASSLQRVTVDFREVGGRQTLDMAQAVESYDNWYRLERPLELHKELLSYWDESGFERGGIKDFFDHYSKQVASQTYYPVEAAWPVLKAVKLLSRDQEMDLMTALLDLYDGPVVPLLVDKTLLMDGKYARGSLQNWVLKEAKHLTGRRIYHVTPEGYPAEGGLGEVIQNILAGDHELGADSVLVQPWYQQNSKGQPLDMDDPVNIGFQSFERNYREFTIRIGNADGTSYRDVKVQVARAVDRNGIIIFQYRDIQQDGTSFFTRRMYQYEAEGNPVTKEESMAFLNVAAAHLIKLLEDERKAEQGRFWKEAVVHGNDGQFGPLQAVMLSLFGDMDTIKDVYWAYKTHTYFNRGTNWQSRWDGNPQGYIRDFLKHMMGIKDRFINAFRALDGDYIDHTSGGIRLANLYGGTTSSVSRNHSNDVTIKDKESGHRIALTNGAMPDKLNKVYNGEFARLKETGVLSSAADPDRPTAIENALTKKAVKGRLNSKGLKSFIGRRVEIDVDAMLIGYVRRLVDEKAGREGAFADENIWNAVKNGKTVVLVGRYQGAISDSLRDQFADLERRIAAAKEIYPEQHKGDFFFLDQASPEDKVVLLGAFDVMIQDSKPHTGAAEYSEEYSVGAYVATGPHREGVIADQGIPLEQTFDETQNRWRFTKIGQGNTLMPRENTVSSWKETVFDPLFELWDLGPEAFYAGAALTNRMIRIMETRITSADNLREYEKGLARREEERRLDVQALTGILSILTHEGITEALLENGRGKAKDPFVFNIVHDRFMADKGGLKYFLSRMRELKDRFGYDAMLGHFVEGHYAAYLQELVKDTKIAKPFSDWMETLKFSEGTNVEKDLRLERFLNAIVSGLQSGGDSAQAIGKEYGGIDARQINVIRQGDLVAGVVSDKALEEMLQNVPGLRGVIVNITPMNDLRGLLGIK